MSDKCTPKESLYANLKSLAPLCEFPTWVCPTSPPFVTKNLQNCVCNNSISFKARFCCPPNIVLRPSLPPSRRCYENCSFVVTAKCSPLPAVDISCLPFLTSQNINPSQTVIVNPKVSTLSVWFLQCKKKYLNSVYLWTSSIINHQTASLSVYARFCVICLLSMSH